MDDRDCLTNCTVNMSGGVGNEQCVQVTYQLVSIRELRIDLNGCSVIPQCGLNGR